MKIEIIKSIGLFLSIYPDDLVRIERFALYINSKITLEAYGNDFFEFLKAYRVARNIRKGYSNELLHLTKEWILNNGKRDATNVQDFATSIQVSQLTPRNRFPLSLASKILMLNNPIRIIPFDSQNSKALGVRTSNYALFYKRLMDYKHKNERIISEALNEIDSFVSTIEKKHSINQIERIRFNRLLDITLWSSA